MKRRKSTRLSITTCVDVGFAFLDETGVRFVFVEVSRPRKIRGEQQLAARRASIWCFGPCRWTNPSSRDAGELLKICQVLGVKAGVDHAALTKSDLGTRRNTLSLAQMDVQDYVRGSVSKEKSRSCWRVQKSWRRTCGY